MPTIKIEKTFEISNQDIEDLLVTAFEGGINYWCDKVIIKEYPESLEDKNMLASDILAHGAVLTLCDAESSDKWDLTLDKFTQGLKMHLENTEYSSMEDLMDSYDANDADCIIQYAIFNELIFG
jgi:hypothetical protein